MSDRLFPLSIQHHKDIHGGGAEGHSLNVPQIQISNTGGGGGGNTDSSLPTISFGGFANALVGRRHSTAIFDADILQNFK